MYQPEHLQLWTEPSAYVGFNPTEDYLFISIHRESTSLDQSNWIRIQEDLQKFVEAGDYGTPTWHAEDRCRNGDWYYVWRASHCLVGWVDYLMIRGDAHPDIVRWADKVLDRLDGYPVYDEDHWSELETDQIYSRWAGESLSYRIQLCAEAGDSIFAARRINDIPENTFYRIRDTWT